MLSAPANRRALVVLVATIVLCAGLIVYGALMSGHPSGTVDPTTRTMKPGVRR